MLAIVRLGQLLLARTWHTCGSQRPRRLGLRVPHGYQHSTTKPFNAPAGLLAYTPAPVLLIGAGSCSGRSESRWSARSVARTYDLDCDLCAALACPAREDRPARSCRCSHRGCVTAGTVCERCGADRVAAAARAGARQRLRQRARLPPARASAPSTPAPAAGLPLAFSVPNSGDPRCAQSLAEAAAWRARRACP